jgi:hypothetical protein
MSVVIRAGSRNDCMQNLNKFQNKVKMCTEKA